MKVKKAIIFFIASTTSFTNCIKKPYQFAETKQTPPENLSYDIPFSVATQYWAGCGDDNNNPYHKDGFMSVWKMSTEYSRIKADANTKPFGLVVPILLSQFNDEYERISPTKNKRDATNVFASLSRDEACRLAGELAAFENVALRFRELEDNPCQNSTGLGEAGAIFYCRTLSVGLGAVDMFYESSPASTKPMQCSTEDRSQCGSAFKKTLAAFKNCQESAASARLVERFCGK